MISIRQMTVEDIPASQQLVAQLGYRIEVSELRRRLDTIDRADGHAVMVADDDGRVIGFCHMYARSAADKPPEAEVQALVVDQAARGLGIGKLMMAAAEAWAAVCGCQCVTLGSHVSRSDAGAFYKSLGYRNDAASRQLRKPLGAPP
jgi:GNAT superfamily N-acetyltransferase